MLRHKIKDIPPEGVRVAETLPEALIHDALSVDAVDPARSAASVDYTLTKSGEDVVLHGHMNATLGLGCDRCLGPARADVQISLDLIFKPEGEEPGEDEDGDPLDSADFGSHDRVWVDEEPFLREQLILAVPMSHLCKSDCKGLCSTCGLDLNQADCGHRSSAAKSPLAQQLASIKDSLKS